MQSQSRGGGRVFYFSIYQYEEVATAPVLAGRKDATVDCNNRLMKLQVSCDVTSGDDTDKSRLECRLQSNNPIMTKN